MTRHALLSIVLIATIVATLTPAPASAQEASVSLKELQRHGEIEDGDTIWVTLRQPGVDDDGDTKGTKAEFIRFAGDAVVVRMDGQTLELAEGRIARLQKRHTDSVLNGLGIGAMIGALAGVVGGSLDAASSTPCASFCFSNVGPGPGAAVIGGAVLGGLLGILVDLPLRAKKTVFEAGETSRPRLTVAPLLSKNGKGMLVSLSF